jgi:outer membrane receptor protein involved in Fe transport
MRFTPIFMLAILLSIICIGQQKLTVKVSDQKSGQPIAGASIILKGSKEGVSADSLGGALIIIPMLGRISLTISAISYEEKQIILDLPVKEELMNIFLEPAENENETVVVKATRSSRTIANIPTRIEIISGEELDEKGNMKPGEMRMLLGESTGIQVQQTSATSYNSTFRIQGLDGRYTQILKDGFPLYSGFSGGLSLMQIPPLDLKQVEVIKGSASTLYGGGAIAGLINLVSKMPKNERNLNFHINGTSAGGLDINGFYAQQFKKFGTAIFASSNSNRAYDPADIGLTAIPKFQRYTINPKLYWNFNAKTNLMVGINSTWEDRTGGDIQYIKGDNSSGYFEKNKTVRFATQESFERTFGNSVKLIVKNSINAFARTISTPDYIFDGDQLSTFTELSYDHHTENLEWIGGINLYTDNFSEKRTDSFPLRSYNQITFGSFLQNIWTARKWLQVESGLRADYIRERGWVVLPRISSLVEFSSKLTSRIGGGLGYKVPNIFTEEAEALHFRNIYPIDLSNTQLERSWGVNADINYRVRLFDGLNFSFNQLFFYTRINEPLILVSRPAGGLEFVTANGHIDTKGIETNVKFIYKNFKLFIGYTFTDAYNHFDSVKTILPLNPRNRLNNVLMYEIEDKLKIGIEAYYFSEEQLTDGSTGRSYWLAGLMAEKIWNRFSVYINFENILDVRQTKFGPIYTGPISNPIFKDIYAPLDGFVINGGIKIRL